MIHANEISALVDPNFWCSFLTKQLRIYLNPCGISYVESEAYSGNGTSYVLLLSEAVESDRKLSGFNLALDLKVMSTLPMKKYVRLVVDKRTDSKKTVFSKHLKALGFAPGSYPMAVCIYQFKQNNRKYVILHHIVSNTRPDLVLTGFDLGNDEVITTKKVQVVSEELPFGNVRTVFCLVPRHEQKIQLSEQLVLSVKDVRVQVYKQDA